MIDKKTKVRMDIRCKGSQSCVKWKHTDVCEVEKMGCVVRNLNQSSVDARTTSVVIECWVAEINRSVQLMMHK